MFGTCEPSHVLPARFIDIEGIDQSGKKTQARLLVAKLQRQGFKVATLGFPVYATPAGREIRAFLSGKRNYPVQAVHMLYSLNRWENKHVITRKLEDADFLVADRYYPSNLAYGLARGLDFNWLATLDQGLPRPDIVVLLDVPVPTSFSRKSRSRDLHESDRALLLQVQRAYRGLARKYHWRVVNAAGPATNVGQEVWKSLANLVNDRRHPTKTGPSRSDKSK